MVIVDDSNELMKTFPKAITVVGGVVVLITMVHAESVFDVRQSGAKGDGKADDTVAIQKALDGCGKAGGGTVLLSKGTYLSKLADHPHKDDFDDRGGCNAVGFDESK
jgi:polygalacturonase